MHNTTHGHKSDLTRAQRGSVTYRSRRRRDTNKPQGKLFPFSFSPKAQVHHSTTQQVGHISKTHYKQHSFGAQGSAEQLCLWELALFLPTLVIISLQYPLHQYSALEHEHCSLFIWRASWAVLSACWLLLLYQQELFQCLENDQTLPKTDIYGRPKGREPNWLGIKSSSPSLQIYSWLTLSPFVGRQLTIDNRQNPTKIQNHSLLQPGLVTHVLPCVYTGFLRIDGLKSPFVSMHSYELFYL